MTPERKEWWDNLPQKEKELREAIAEHEKWIKINKSYLPDGSNNIEYVKKMLRRQKLITKALKHELERGGRADMLAIKVPAPAKTNLYYCCACEHLIEDDSVAPDYRYCPRCGTKLSGEVKMAKWEFKKVKSKGEK